MNACVLKGPLKTATLVFTFACTDTSLESQETTAPQRFIGTALEAIAGADFSLDPVGA